ncbi:MAG: DUF3105 domain-containing protein [Dehalococcoidia bacterium]|nr:DUF3105 domain-containing protein [Dehalococcoidia bacterium]
MSRTKQPRSRKQPPARDKAKGREKASRPRPGMAQGTRPWLIAVAVLVLVVAGALILLMVGRKEAPTTQSFPIQGTQHIRAGESHPAYNSNPPTSGWHYDTPASWGISEREITDEQVVHNLEHGGIWISYQPSLDGGTVDRLREIVRRYRSKVLLTPRAKNDSKIALAAWGRLDTFDVFDEGRIVTFIEGFKDQGPEKVPD